MPRTKAILYVRVSLEKMAERGMSLDAQKAKGEAYAALYDLEIIQTIVDPGASAKTLERPGLDRARALLKSKKADALLVAKLDRLTRSVRDLGHLIEEDFAPGRAALLSVSEQIDTRTAGGRLVLNILGSVSQWEREVIGERTSVAMGEMRKQGRYTGGRARFGFDVGEGTLIPNEEEQAVMAQARELRTKGMTLRGIVRELETLGHRSRASRPFALRQVARMLAA